LNDVTGCDVVWTSLVGVCTIERNFVAGDYYFTPISLYTCLALAPLHSYINIEISSAELCQRLSYNVRFSGISPRGYWHTIEFGQSNRYELLERLVLVLFKSEMVNYIEQKLAVAAS
jgi:hypothetical protein